MTRRSLTVTLAAAAVSFAVVLGAFLVLASPGARPHVKMHVRKPVFGGGRVAGQPGEFAGKDCTITFTDNTGNHDWHRPGNWSPPRLPGPKDVACIPAGKTVEVRHDVTIKGFVNHGHLTLSGGNMKVTGHAESG